MVHDLIGSDDKYIYYPQKKFSPLTVQPCPSICSETVIVKPNKKSLQQANCSKNQTVIIPFGIEKHSIIHVTNSATAHLAAFAPENLRLNRCGIDRRDWTTFDPNFLGTMVWIRGDRGGGSCKNDNGTDIQTIWLSLMLTHCLLSAISLSHSL